MLEEFDVGDIPADAFDAIPEPLRECVIDELGEDAFDDLEVLISEKFQKAMIDCALGQ